MNFVLQQLFKHLPHQRTLSTEEKNKASRLIGLRVNKKLLQQELTQDSGKIILLKDLTNLASLGRSQTRNNLDATFTLLKDKYGK